MNEQKTFTEWLDVIDARNWAKRQQDLLISKKLERKLMLMQRDFRKAMKKYPVKATDMVYSVSQDKMITREEAFRSRKPEFITHNLPNGGTMKEVYNPLWNTR